MAGGPGYQNPLHDTLGVDEEVHVGGAGDARVPEFGRIFGLQGLHDLPLVHQIGTHRVGGRGRFRHQLDQLVRCGCIFTANAREQDRQRHDGRGAQQEKCCLDAPRARHPLNQPADATLELRPPLGQRHERQTMKTVASGADAQEQAPVGVAVSGQPMHHPPVAVQFDGEVQTMALEPEGGIPGEDEQGQRHQEAEPGVACSDVLLFVREDQLLLIGADGANPRGQHDAGPQEADYGRAGIPGPEHRAMAQRTGLPRPSLSNQAREGEQHRHHEQGGEHHPAQHEEIVEGAEHRIAGDRHRQRLQQWGRVARWRSRLLRCAARNPQHRQCGRRCSGDDPDPSRRAAVDGEEPLGRQTRDQEQHADAGRPEHPCGNHRRSSFSSRSSSSLRRRLMVCAERRSSETRLATSISVDPE